VTQEDIDTLRELLRSAETGDIAPDR
jgi:hypothetical protein